ncbi:MAG: 4-hydroxy-tetrahydrodipicolinate synthase [Flavobacteriales bacterium]|nr:4-hydroxy-tetrahydrodipicolinate synthase [Flavobacteriales bacterium]
MIDLSGLGVAMVTPFTADGNIDFNGLKNLTEHLIEGGVDVLVVQGTTGESPALTSDEKRKVLDYVLDVNQGRTKVAFGIGGNSTSMVVDQMKSFNADGVSAILSVSPYYNKPTQAGIVAHYQAIAEAAPAPIILYNVPGRTGSNMLAETTLALADHENIAAMKEASGDLSQIEEIIQHKPSNFQVISGDDGLTLPMIALGAEGLISVVGNAYPAEFGKMVHAAMKGNLDIAKPIHFQFKHMIEFLFVEGNPGGVKEVLKHLNICEHHMRLPLLPVSEKTKAALIAEANSIA